MAEVLAKLRRSAQTLPLIRAPDYPGTLHTIIGFVRTTLEATRRIRILRVLRPTDDPDTESNDI
jgi:hypothetical protein